MSETGELPLMHPSQTETKLPQADMSHDKPAHAASSAGQELSPVELQQQEEALRAIQQAISSQQAGGREEPMPSPAEVKPAPANTIQPAEVLRQVASRLTAPFRGIMNLIRSIGRWIAK